MPLSGTSPGPDPAFPGIVPLQWLSLPDVGTDAGTGDFGRRFEFGGIDRYYEVHVPPGYDPAVPMPVMLMLHAGGGYAAEQRWVSMMDETADEEGFIVVYLAGTGDSGPYEDLYWNTGRGMLDPADELVDDVAYARFVLDELPDYFNTDTQRVYAAGYEDGGAMVYRLGAELGARIVAIAAVAGQTAPSELVVPPVGPLSVIQFSGLLDLHNPNAGGASDVVSPVYDPYVFTSAADVLDDWDANLGVTTEIYIETTATVTLERRGEVGVTSGPEVVLVTLSDGGNTWPDGHVTERLIASGSSEEINRLINASETIWAFFAQHALPDAATGGGSGGALYLSDLLDVNAPTPADTEVLTWDAGTSQWVPAAAAGGALVDGDMGDVVVSGGGTVLTVDANAISLAKLADMPSSRIIGRVTAGSGDPEALTQAQMKTFLAYVLADVATDAQVLTAVKNVDGAGSGLDADLLDGAAHRGAGGSAEHPDATGATSGFMTAADSTKLAGIAAGAQVNPTAAAILASLLTVDGPGSGLDADTVDGAAPVTDLEGLSDVDLTTPANRDVLQYETVSSQWKNITMAALAANLPTTTVAKGGTGQITEQLAINALTAVSGATNEHVLTKDTASGNATFKAVPAGGVSDGDKGDITVSSTGTVWTVDPAAITYAKIQDVTAERLLGRWNGGAGPPQEIEVDASLELASLFLGVATNGINNTHIADMATATIKGRATAGTGNPEDLTTTQVKALLGLDNVDVQAFTGSGGTWTKPTTFVPKVTMVVLYSGGGGGGGGGSQTGAIVRAGGAGGGGGVRVERTYLSSLLGATETVVLGAGGLSGTAGASGAAGGAGGVGGASTFSSGINLLTAFPGGGGALGAASAAAGGGGGGGGAASAGSTGTTSVGTGGLPGRGVEPSGGCGSTGLVTATTANISEYGGGAGGGHTNVPANGLGGGSMFGGAGGGVGGGATVAPALIAATAGGAAVVAGGGGGGAGTSGASPTAGTAGTAGNYFRGGYGGGGGGGTITASTAGAAGGDGGLPAGGGGGGGVGSNTGIGGAGGVGGAGLGWVISW